MSDGQTTIARCTLHENETDTLYYKLLTTVYPPFELAFFFCLPLLINISCTILIVRSLSIRMRTAERFHSAKEQRATVTMRQRILSFLLPKTASKSSVHSCFCFRIQCRRHTRLRLKVSRSLRSLQRDDDEGQTGESASNAASQESHSQYILRTTSHILNKKHRSRRTRDLHLSAMLIGLNVLYLLLNLPFNFHQTFTTHLYQPTSDRCSLLFNSLLLDSLQQTFFSTNFFLYVLTNRRFREEFYNTLMSIWSHCKRHSSRLTGKRASLPPRQRISSCNQSTVAVTTNPASDNPLVSFLAGPYRDSTGSEREPTDTSVSQPQTVVSFNEHGKCTTRVTMTRDSSED